ncbi:hypothetical protein [Hyphomicrobium sp.]|uniref:hypothetical protein n=1 Tax=Hyphomicrobium sp. TaxID=82 RepID=UPI002D154D09|nr:hypothetical protein [Hyphomicrobium sp.]HVZ04090.1 hypothetical protein [Hyphomicrobium sp.]
MAAEDPSLRERLVGLKVRRDELAQELADLQKRMAADEPAITPKKIAAFAALRKDKLRNGLGWPQTSLCAAAAARGERPRQRNPNFRLKSGPGARRIERPR